jgi:hypothetical protein
MDQHESMMRTSPSTGSALLRSARIGVLAAVTLDHRARRRLKSVRRKATITARNAARRAGGGRRASCPLYADGRGLAFAAGAAWGMLAGISIGRAWARGPGRRAGIEDLRTAADAAAAAGVKDEQAAADDAPPALETGRRTMEQAAQTDDQPSATVQAATAGGEHDDDGRDQVG